MRRSVDPLVSTAWLASQLPGSGRRPGGERRAPGTLVVVDVREPHLYDAGHIHGAISIPFSPVSDWAISTEELLMELPEEADLLRVISDHGMGTDSRVVIVTTLDKPPAPPYSLSDATRVAATLIHAGVKNVAILDGGHPKWVREGREITTIKPRISPAIYRGEIHGETFVSTEYVKDRLGSSLILDARDAEEYSGVRICPFAGKAGHIPTAWSLPAVWLWEADGTYRSVELLAQMALTALGGRTPGEAGAEIILYCGVGGYASAWWFVLTQVLGYTNVKIYDGAAEAWAKENDMVL